MCSPGIEPPPPAPCIDTAAREIKHPWLGGMGQNPVPSERCTYPKMVPLALTHSEGSTGSLGTGTGAKSLVSRPTEPLAYCLVSLAPDCSKIAMNVCCETTATRELERPLKNRPPGAFPRIPGFISAHRSSKLLNSTLGSAPCGRPGLSPGPQPELAGRVGRGTGRIHARMKPVSS